MQPPLRPPASDRAPWTVFALAYATLIAYGSLHPFADWGQRVPTLLAFLTPRPYAGLSRVDVITNILAYVPLGLLLVLRKRGEKSHVGPVVAATLAGALLSFAVEFTQQFLPGRVPSLADLVTNIIGTLAGALLAAFVRADTRPGRRLIHVRGEWFLPGRLTDLGLLAVALWALSQLTPLVPSLDIGNLRHGVAPVLRTMQSPDRFGVVQAATYFFAIAGLASLARTLVRPGHSATTLFFAFVAGVLLLKIPVITRQLSLEAIAGTVAALVFGAAVAVRRPNGRESAWIGALLVGIGFVVAELAPDPAGTAYPFNWIPFRGQLENTLIGFASILESIWPAAALAYLARYVCGSAHGAIVAWAGGFALAATALALEWHQQDIPGRYGDVTIAVLMALTWLLFWRVKVPEGDAANIAATPDTERVPGQATGPAVVASAGVRQRVRLRPALLVSSLAISAVIGAGALLTGERAVEVRVDESKLPQLPAPHELPPARLPGFRYQHPRLPAPTERDIATLATANPGFVRDVRNRARGGEGDIETSALLELLEPGTVDLDALHRRLMELRPGWRGHVEGKPLALAYDWLYARWSEPQRVQLRGKLVEACNYLIERIRKERLSPYNVFLYNAPFQALMACSLALYGDDPRGDAVMSFTQDYWKNRVLPVWRQVMGRNGGWHEGGEYVGIGIGQAIHQVPAMWRHATGEDLFATNPGIRGFLDFLVYRTRPDGTHFRWGDGSFFDRIVPDATPLALEFGHAAAYSLRGGRTKAVPAGWPWGPFTDAALFDPGAVERLPLARHFDGIGMIVARSDWSADATYVTFKAGDNFWSHVHLDQGAFTIYKGGELAIDSGVYGPQYGSDHHMNYAYQSIAHNTITVSDPDDRVPAPTKKDPRPIANDGGQRRIGSGWGMEAAPLDLAEWNAKRDVYHTAAMGAALDRDGLIVVAANVTPAYTNAKSGEGTFSHRTRRVERFWRTFGYDRIDDAIVVFDQVVATEPAFRKRWLLHTLERPEVRPGGFTVSVPPQERLGHAGGRLEAKVLLPREAAVTAIGGPGFEFYVDGRNYDENGALHELIRKLGPNRREAGAWRVEVSPARDASADNFLVVLLPAAPEARPAHRVRFLESDGRVGCEIAGPKRTTRWWFEPGRNGADIEVIADGETRRHRVVGPQSPPPLARTWLDRVRKWIRFSTDEAQGS